jgi:hypothetical protein
MSIIGRLHELDEKGEVNTQEAKELAQNIYDNGLPLHPCYWNDRLYLALRFGLDEERQKTAVKNSIIVNGANRYFEQKTHYGFNNRKLLQEQGIPLELLSPEPDEGGAYCYECLDKKVIKIMADKFGIDPNKRHFPASSFNYLS